MTYAVAFPVFAVAATVSLATSWVLVTRLERVGERLGLSEAVLGLLAAFAADTPEITSAVTALANHERAVGSGVILGSNLFNLAALLGLGAVVAGTITLHRRVILLSGSVALWVALVSVAAATGTLDAGVALAVVLLALVPYAVVLSSHRGAPPWLLLPTRWKTWLSAAASEEELELRDAIRPERGSGRDAALAGLALAVVVGASIAMERVASSLGTHFAIAGIVTGGLVLAAVTSLPNAVAAVYLAARGRGAAVLSIALNSNTINILAGLLAPGAVIGLASPSAQETVIAGSYAGLTVLTLAFAYRHRGVRRWVGFLIIASYLAFAAGLLAST